jgi:hypothetical protein
MLTQGRGLNKVNHKQKRKRKGGVEKTINKEKIKENK